MAYITILPKSVEVQQRLTHDCVAVMNILHQAVKTVFNVSDNDIIVELNQCVTIAFNPSAIEALAVPDVVIKIATSDHEFRPEFQTLCDHVLDSWNATFEDPLKLEVWVDVIDTWGCNIELD